MMKWEMDSPFFMKESLFRGGFDWPGAVQVLEAHAARLRSCLNKKAAGGKGSSPSSGATTITVCLTQQHSHGHGGGHGEVQLAAMDGQYRTSSVRIEKQRVKRQLTTSVSSSSSSLSESQDLPPHVPPHPFPIAVTSAPSIVLTAISCKNSAMGSDKSSGGTEARPGGSSYLGRGSTSASMHGSATSAGVGGLGEQFQTMLSAILVIGSRRSDEGDGVKRGRALVSCESCTGDGGNTRGSNTRGNKNRGTKAKKRSSAGAVHVQEIAATFALIPFFVGLPAHFAARTSSPQHLSMTARGGGSVQEDLAVMEDEEELHAEAGRHVSVAEIDSCHVKKSPMMWRFSNLPCMGQFALDQLAVAWKSLRSMQTDGGASRNGVTRLLTGQIGAEEEQLEACEGDEGERDGQGKKRRRRRRRELRHRISRGDGQEKKPLLAFARVQGEPRLEVEEAQTGVGKVGGGEETIGGGDSPPAPVEPLPGLNGTPQPLLKLLSSIKLPRLPDLHAIPISSSLVAASLSDIVDMVPVMRKGNYPDRKRLVSVQDFFRYTESEGRRLFDELDRDGDGQVTLEDLEVAMKKRRLPQDYARRFLRTTRKHWFAKSFGWDDFHSLMDEKEPSMLRAFNSLNLSASGTLQKGQVLTSLKRAGLPATEDNADAMMRFLNADLDGRIAYGHFRNFLILLPRERLGDDPSMVWFEAATVVPMVPPPVPAGSVLKSALAGGLVSGVSTSMMYPLDTLKTRVQASTLSLSEVLARVPEGGVRGLYRGAIPAIIGQFSSHGLRTGVMEITKLLLKNVAPDLPAMQVQTLASICSTIIGTACRIPCEVIKQRLQAGLYKNVGEVVAGTMKHDGIKGFFRGTGVTLCREVPFYVTGLVIYEEMKKVANSLLKRELKPWETIAVGGLSGGLAAIMTTPFDVMKTRMMTSSPGVHVTMSGIALSIVRNEGALTLFKGWLPRFFWIAPLGAMNFAGYELAKRAMEKKEEAEAGAPGNTTSLSAAVQSPSNQYQADAISHHRSPKSPSPSSLVVSVPAASAVSKSIVSTVKTVAHRS